MKKKQPYKFNAGKTRVYKKQNNNIVNFSVSEELIRVLDKESQKRNISRAEYMRQALINQLHKEDDIDLICKKDELNLPKRSIMPRLIYIDGVLFRQNSSAYNHKVMKYVRVEPEVN